jgi:hypothetical protein
MSIPTWRARDAGPRIQLGADPLHPLMRVLFALYGYPNHCPSRRRTFWERPSHALPDRRPRDELWCRSPAGLQARAQ